MRSSEDIDKLREESTTSVKARDELHDFHGKSDAQILQLLPGRSAVHLVGEYLQRDIQGEEDGEVILTEREKDNKAKHDARVGTLNDAEDFSRVGGFHRVRPHDEIILMHGVGDEVAPEYESDFHG